MPITNKISMNVDIDDPKIENVPIVTQGDTIELTVNVLKSGVAYDLSNVTTISLVTTRPDNLIVVDEGTVLTGNQAVFNMSTRSTAVAGTDKIVVQAYDDSLDRVSTMAGVLVVMDDMSNNEQALGDDDQSLIKQVLGDGPDIISAAQTATTAANDATTAANTATTAANTAADSANTAADSANTAATSATNAAASANTAADAANTATQNANDATTAANTATENANTATQEANDATTAANSAATAANGAADNVNDAINSATTIWLAPVAAYSDVATTYTTPSLGDTVQVLDTGFVYRYDGTQWVYTQGYSATAIADINAKLTNQDSQSTTLLHGLSAITTDQATATDVRIFGRTLVNLLGKDGNCEDVSKFTTIGSASVDSAVYKYGNKSLKITGAVAGGAGVQKDISIDNTADYLILTDVKSDSALQFYLAIQKSDGTTIKQSATVTTSSIFGISYVKISSVDLAGLTSLKIYARFALTASGQNGWIDGLRLFKIPQSIRDKVDVDTAYTGDALAAKFPYVDSVQHVMNPFVKNSGKNLIPPFTSGEWTLHANAKVLEDYELELDATATNQNSYVSIPVSPKQSYTISSPTSLDSSKYFTIREYDVNGNFTSRSFISGTSYTFITASTTVSLTILTTNVGAGTFTFTNPQLELGSTATPFEPQNESYLYVAQDADKNPIVLASNNDGSVADEVYRRDGQWYRLNRFVRDMVLDGSLGWTYGADYVGFKKVACVGLLNGVHNSEIAIKYNAVIVNNVGGAWDKPDESQIWDNVFNITITDTDSGWGETYTPSVSEIKAYFFGWRMNNGTFGTAYSGTGTKTWVPIGDTDNTRATTVLPTSDAPTIAEGKIDHYKLTYQLSQATEEAIEVEGSLDLIAGGNQLQVGEAVVIREKTTPKTYSGAANYYINNTYVNSLLKYKAKTILAIYKNGEVDTQNWVIQSTSYQYNYGETSASISNTNFDPTAEYTVTYVALDTYKLSSAENNVEITYNTNIKTVVDAVVKKQEDDETDISVLKLQMIDAIARLTAGGL